VAILVSPGKRRSPLTSKLGAIKVFDYEQGFLSNEVSVAPSGGRTFEPGHLDFHLIQAWIFSMKA